MDCSNRPLRNNWPIAREEEKNAKISVWWDIKSCRIPTNCSPWSIINNLMQALRQSGFQGEISIFIFGNAREIQQNLQAQVNFPGSTFIHVPDDGDGDAIGRKLITRLLLWASDNPAPTNILAISGDKDLRRTLLRLEDLKYNVLLAYERPANIPSPADIVWQLESLLNAQPF